MNILVKDPDIIRSMFDRIASTYDILNSVLSLSMDRLWRKQAIRSLDIKWDDAVLDVGTGTGNMAISALKTSASMVHGIDISRGMIDIARSKARAMGLDSRYILCLADALSMPFGDALFDKAMVAFGIRNMRDIVPFLEEMHRVLKPGALFSVLELSTPGNWLFRIPYSIYFRYMLPWIGGVISGKMGAYTYLRDSVMRFPSPGKLAGIMETCGFRVVRIIPLFFGVCHNYMLEKTLDHSSIP